MLINGADGLVADPLVFLYASRAQYSVTRFLQSVSAFLPEILENISANLLCSMSTKFRCVVGSRSFSTAMDGDLSCGREQRISRSEQVAATRRWPVLLPQSALRYTRQFWTMFQRAETMMLSNSFFVQPSLDIQVQRCMLRRLNQEPVIFIRCRACRARSRSPLSFLLPDECVARTDSKPRLSDPRVASRSSRTTTISRRAKEAMKYVRVL